MYNDRIHADQFQPGSYTHLDVYKRQLVPTSDLNAPVGIALCVIVMSIY